MTTPRASPHRTSRPGRLALAWGRRYLMVEPSHFRVDYAINPFMDVSDQPDPVRAREQWQALVETLRAVGADVEVLAQRPDAPDMVYAMNLGLVLNRGPHDRHVVMSHMRYPQRRMETGTAQSWFAEHGFTTSYVGRDGVGAHLEAGDAFVFGDALVVGYGPRTEELALKHLAVDLDVRVRGLHLTHPGMYHLDLAFCPLDATHAMVCPAAFDETVGRCGAGPGARAAGAERGRGDDLLRELRRRGPHGRDAGVPAPGPGRAGGVGLRGGPRRRQRAAQGRRLGALPDQPARRRPRS